MMRISIHRNDPGYRAYVDMKRAGRDVRVFLNSIERKNCVTADDVAGEVLLWDRPTTELVKGAVRIELYDTRSRSPGRG